MAGTLGVVLSGGRSQRFGDGDKAFAPLSGTPLIIWVLDALRPQVNSMAINANGEIARYQALGYPVITDGGNSQDGPVAGILAALRHATKFGFRDVVTVPCDAPFIPARLVMRLHAARGTSSSAFAKTDGHLNPVFALYRIDVMERIAQAFDDGVRAPRELAGLLGTGVAMFTGEEARAFADIDTPTELAAIQRSGRAKMQGKNMAKRSRRLV